MLQNERDSSQDERGREHLCSVHRRDPTLKRKPTAKKINLRSYPDVTKLGAQSCPAGRAARGRAAEEGN